MEQIRCHVCGAQSTITHASHCSFRGLPEHRRIAELERERDEARDKVAELEWELDNGASWQSRVTSYLENCPICFSDDECGHLPRCLWDQAETKVAELEGEVAEKESAAQQRKWARDRKLDKDQGVLFEPGD